MTILVIPAAGKSSRYGLDRPKFLLTHPSGGTMLSSIIDGLGDLNKLGISSIRIISLIEFFENISVEKLQNEISKKFDVPVEIDLLDFQTSSVIETLNLSLSKLKKDEPIIIKDCDSLVSFNEHDDFNSNYLMYANLEKFPEIIAYNKSFLNFDFQNNLNEIIEKNIISKFINVGCIKINSISDFLSISMSLSSVKELYMSDILRAMINKGYNFKCFEVKDYEDWGTINDWKNYINKFATIFIDLDGVLLINENPLGINFDWNSFRPIKDNLEYLQKIVKDEKKQIIFTTSRSEDHRGFLENELLKCGFKNFKLLMSLNHSKRYIVNDFSKTNPYPSAVAVNIERNSNNLSEYLNFT